MSWGENGTQKKEKCGLRAATTWSYSLVRDGVEQSVYLGEDLLAI